MSNDVASVNRRNREFWDTYTHDHSQPYQVGFNCAVVECQESGERSEALAEIDQWENQIWEEEIIKAQKKAIIDSGSLVCLRVNLIIDDLKDGKVSNQDIDRLHQAINRAISDAKLRRALRAPQAMA